MTAVAMACPVTFPVLRVKLISAPTGQNFDFGVLSISSGADVILDNNLEEEISVETEKADGKKCSICWKIRQDKCEIHICNF